VTDKFLDRPILDGYRATQMLRHSEPYASEERLKNIPIIAMTASAIQGDKEKCQRAGMNDYLSKPVRGKVLEQMLVKWAIKGRDRRPPRIVEPSSENTPHLSPAHHNTLAPKPARPGPSTLSHAQNVSQQDTPPNSNQTIVPLPSEPEQTEPPRLGDITMPDSSDSLITQLQFDSSEDEDRKNPNGTFDNSNSKNYSSLERSMETEGAGAQRRFWAQEKAMTLRDDKLMQITDQSRAEREDAHNEVTDADGDNNDEMDTREGTTTVMQKSMGGYFPPQPIAPPDTHIDPATPGTERSEASAALSTSRPRMNIATSNDGSVGTKASVGSGYRRLGLTRENMEALADEYHARDESRRRGGGSRDAGSASRSGTGNRSAGTGEGQSQMS